MSRVIWVDAQHMAFDNSVPHKLHQLIHTSGAVAELSEGMRVALKINTAEEGYEYGLRPSLLRIVAEAAHAATKTRPIVCDGLKLVDYWKKSMGNLYMQVASARGYSNETLGGHFVINGGFSGDEGDLFACNDVDAELGGVEVGTAVCRSDALWVLSHVTLHPLFGLSGALLNGGFDCLVGRARTRVLDGLNPYPFNGYRPKAEDVHTFQRRALECLQGVNKAVENRVFYINYLWDVTPQPEYFPYSDSPLVQNLGFLAASDPVALDHATYHVLQQADADLAEAVTAKFPDVLRAAEAMDLGQRDGTLERLS
ncbi:MAG: DUF362 domain-containing protein [Desulfosarcinaceae bacterium]|nr:DUF362 domain-containing protein [Desulfosarcinaceae bacterium]